jgi:hypothetical protein
LNRPTIPIGNGGKASDKYTKGPDAGTRQYPANPSAWIQQKPLTKHQALAMSPANHVAK